LIGSALSSVSTFAKAEEPVQKPKQDVTALVPNIECYDSADLLERAKKARLEPVMVGRNMDDGMTVLWMGSKGFVFTYTKDGSDQSCVLGNLLNPHIDQLLIDRLTGPKKDS
jgi:hypothetical protein